MNKTNIKNLEAIRDYLDKLIDNADEYIAELDEEIAQNEQRIDELIEAREALKHALDRRDA